MTRKIPGASSRSSASERMWWAGRLWRLAVDPAGDPSSCGWLWRRCDELVLGLVLLILVTGPLATGAVQTDDFLVLQSLSIFLVLVWVVRLCGDPRYQLGWPPVCWAVLAFVVYAVLRYQQSALELVARAELVHILTYACLFVVVLNTVRRDGFARVIVEVLLLVAAGIAFYAVYQFVADSDRIWRFARPPQYAGRASGTYINPNHLAGFLEMVLPMSLALVVATRGVRIRPWAYGTAAVLIWAGIGCTLSRSGWVACGSSLVLLMCWLLRHSACRRHALIWSAVLVVSAAVFLLRSDRPRERLGQAFAAGRIQDIRFPVWRAAVRMWEEHPW